MIVVFGSMNVDLSFNVGNLPKLGETVLCSSCRTVAGGKGLNQAVAAARARPVSEVPVRMVGCVGDDHFADIALDALKVAGVEIGAVTRSPRPTGCAAVMVDAVGNNQIVVASGANEELFPEALPEAWLCPDTVLVLQTEVSTEAICAVIDKAKRCGARVVLNLAPVRLLPEKVIRVLDLLVLNEVEASVLLGHHGISIDSGQTAAQEISRQYSVTTIVTLGRLGACSYGVNEAWKIGVLPVSPIDTVGAGDAFVGGLAVGLALDQSLPETLRRASIGAGLSCLSQGAAQSMPSAAEIDSRYAELLPACTL